jgi:alpha-L-fucosidase
MDNAPAPTTNAVEPMKTGRFEPTWESLAQYEVPGWFRDAKFGMWAHWGPQCQPEGGDWYARHMYAEGHDQYKFHLAKYGHPSTFGFKDVINEWKAEKWDPEKLVALYKRAGAQYFFAMANHHDNLDLWDSTHQAWNSVAVGPKKNIMAGWARAAKNNGLRLGVSVHASHAWSWYETSQGADKAGPLAGVPYDGKLTKADGKGGWWEGLDPQELYAQRHAPSPDFDQPRKLHDRWDWSHGVSTPDGAYCENFYDRTVELINKYEPELVYFDDTILPLWPVSDAGLKIAAHLYNSSIARHGKLEAVLFGKILNEAQRRTMVWDVERGASDRIEPLPWQTDTCIGDWHYNRTVYDRKQYKSAKTVVQMLADVVSKNGNLLLNIPVRGDGTIDEQELAVVEGITAWMDVNKEAILATRPWKVCGEGPALAAAAPLTAQGFNEGKGKPFTAEDVRFTTKGNDLYAIVMGDVEQPVSITSLGREAGLLDRKIEKVELLGSGEAIRWSQTDAALVLEAPREKAIQGTPVFKITTR